MRAQDWTIRRPPDRPARPGAPAFTLIEMLLVLSVIAILGAIVLPSLIGLFTAGADAQAYNVLAGQLAAARSLAIRQRTYAGLHAQRADPNGDYLEDLGDTCFTAVLWHDPNDSDPNRFTLAEGFSPQKLPGSIAFGRVDQPFYDETSNHYAAADIATDQFTALTFVFDAQGQLVTGKLVTFPANDPSCPAFDDPGTRAYLWAHVVANHADCNTSVDAAVMFDYRKFAALDEDDRPDFLEKYGQLVVVNPYTGTLLER